MPAGFQGTYVLTPPGTRWNEVINAAAVSVMSPNGIRGDLNVVLATPAQNLLNDAVAIWTNTHSNMRMYRGVPTGTPVFYYEAVTDEWVVVLFACPCYGTRDLDSIRGYAAEEAYLSNAPGAIR